MKQLTAAHEIKEGSRVYICNGKVYMYEGYFDHIEAHDMEMTHHGFDFHICYTDPELNTFRDLFENHPKGVTDWSATKRTIRNLLKIGAIEYKRRGRYEPICFNWRTALFAFDENNNVIDYIGGECE